MLDRVVMDVMKVVGKVTLIADDVIPKTSLPNLDLAGQVVCFFVVQRKVSLYGVHDL